MTVVEMDAVRRPAHYTKGQVEAIDIIEQVVAGYEDPVEAYLVGQVLKYLIRAPHKGTRGQCLGKAGWYLTRLINRANDGKRASV
jgi:hypothetical protein